MRLPAATRQVEILADITGRLQHVTRDEAKAVDVVFDALESLGFTGHIRLRLARVFKQENVIALQYARGKYGNLPLQNLTYRLDASQSLTGYVYQKRKALFTEIKEPAIPYLNRSRQWKELVKIQSFMALPVFVDDEVVAVLSLDSTKKATFSDKLLPILRPYQYILGTILSSVPHEVPSDPDLTKWIDESRRRRVLLLGKDTGEELKRLLDIREALASHHYEAVLVKEHPDIPELSNEDKVRTFAGLCRFVLIENSYPAGQIVECKICSTNRIVTAAIRQDGVGSSFMVTDYFKDFDFMKEFVYATNAGSLTEAVGQAVDWAEKKIGERREYFDSVYPWRVRKNEQA